MKTLQMIQLAYKKLKGAIYLDKSQLPLVADVAHFEIPANGQTTEETVTEKLKNIEQALENEDVWEQYSKSLLSKIDTYVYPKKLKKPAQPQMYVNYSNEQVYVEELQYFIKAPVEVHILGVLWVMTIGYWLDQNENANPPMYPQAYGNRLKKKLKNPKSDEFYQSPKLFVPYFANYTSWRDEAIRKAREILGSDKDVMILTMDLKRFFYSVHIPRIEYDQILNNLRNNAIDRHIMEWEYRLHDFTYDVMAEYSKLIRDINIDPNMKIPKGRVLLPIGYYPSSILSNWVLSGFDRAVCDEINPVYYGRYVDDILIVDKVEQNSNLSSCIMSQLVSGEGSKNDVISHYFYCNRTGCPHTIFDKVQEIDHFETNSSKANDIKTCRNQQNLKDNQEIQYRLKPEVLFKHLQTESKLFDICVQNEKVKTFYFKAGSSMALLDTFEKHIRENTSMFRMMPDMQKMFQFNDYSELFTLNGGDSPNKLNSVDNVSISAYATSVFLGKYRKTAMLIDDNKENVFEKDIIKIFDSYLLIDQYILWERLLEIMVINENKNGYTQIVKAVLEAMKKISGIDDLIKSKYKGKVASTLNDTLQCAMARTLSLCWGKDFLEIMDELQDYRVRKEIKDKRFTGETIRSLKFGILNSRMTNRYESKFSPDFYLPRAKEIKDLKITDLKLRDINDNLSKISAFYNCFERTTQNRLVLESYSYRPYVVKPEDICYTKISSEIFDGVPVISKPDMDEITEYFEMLNGFVHKDDDPNNQEWPATLKIQNSDVFEGSNRLKLYAVSVPTKEKKNKFRIALGSVNHDESFFIKALQNRADKSNARYVQLSTLLNDAVKQKADILILPEAYMPFEWIPDVTRFCAANDLMLITGIEHIQSINQGKQPKNGNNKNGKSEPDHSERKKLVYNLTAVILPYQKDDYRFAHVVYHQKVHPSPDEKKKIEGYDYHFASGNSYELYQWKDLWFNVQCCFELASISDRAIFRSMPDLSVAVEWNRDVNYYSNIIESLSRDLHVYCAQVNIAQYGDSRLTQPTKTENKDIIKTKGGLEPAVLSADIDIEKLRNFQIMSHELQTDENNKDKFKPTPPDFNREFTKKKIKGSLWRSLEKNKKTMINR